MTPNTFDYAFTVLYKHPKRNKLHSIIVRFNEEDLEKDTYGTTDPVMCASRMAHELASRQDWFSQGCIEYGISKIK